MATGWHETFRQNGVINGYDERTAPIEIRASEDQRKNNEARRVLEDYRAVEYAHRFDKEVWEE